MSCLKHYMSIYVRSTDLNLAAIALKHGSDALGILWPY